MNQKDKAVILKQMENLKGKTIYTAGRLAATGNFSFLSADKKEYWLRISTGFRFRTGQGVLIANLDMFEPTEAIETSPDFDWDTYNWDVQGCNLYDQWMAQVDKKSLIVSDVNVGDFGDLTVVFSNNTVLEVFINASGGECWRFFEGRGGHLVVAAAGVNVQ